jgi:hypothetical protein
MKHRLSAPLLALGSLASALAACSASESAPPPAAPPAAAPAPPSSDVPWGASGADPALFLRPELRARVAAELPKAGAANVADLVAAVEKLKPIAAAHHGASRPRGKPWEPEKVYEPSDEEILLSIAGDRVWRTTQIAPAGTLDRIRGAHPDLPQAFEYPHLEVSRIEAAGTGPVYVAAPPETRRVGLAGTPR